jgi:hypothetical protein
MRIVGSLRLAAKLRPLWLTARKWPGKICRQQAVSPLRRLRAAANQK